MRPTRHTSRYAVELSRVSTAEQGNSGLGLEAQQASVRAFVSAQGWILVAEYFDFAGGKDDRRPGFQAAITRCRQIGAGGRTRTWQGSGVGGDRGYQPATGPDAGAAALARREAAERTAHRLALEVRRYGLKGLRPFGPWRGA